MKKLYLWTIPALALLAGCAKSDDNQDQQTKTTDKVIVEYLGVEDLPDDFPIGALPRVHERFFSEENVIFPAAGGQLTIQTNESFRPYISWASKILSPEIAVNLYIGDVDQNILTPEQSTEVTVDGYPLIKDGNSCVRVPNGDLQCKVRYSDGTFGYIPDSTLVTAYPVAGNGYEGYARHMDESDLIPMLITGITGLWFNVTTDALEPYTKIEIPVDYFPNNAKTLEDRTKYTNRGLIQERFYDVRTTYIYPTCLPLPEPGAKFTVEVLPNTTGQPRSFTLGFPYNWFGGWHRELFTVTQQ